MTQGSAASKLYARTSREVRRDGALILKNRNRACPARRSAPRLVRKTRDFIPVGGQYLEVMQLLKVTIADVPRRVGHDIIFENRSKGLRNAGPWFLPLRHVGDLVVVILSVCDCMLCCHTINLR